MRSPIYQIFIFLLLAAFVAGCSGQPAAAVESPTAEATAADELEPTAAVPTAESTPAEEVAADETTVGDETAPQDAQVTTEGTAETPAEAPTALPTAPAPDTISLTQQPYISPSDAFTINFPENWNCSETGLYRVDCYNPSQTAETLVSVTATGYGLVQEDFLAMAHAQLVSAYQDVKAYTEVSQEESDGTLINEATWREGNVYWHSIDRFVRSGSAVYRFTFASVQDQIENYRPVFNEMLQKVVLNSTPMSGAPLYAFRKEYASREQIFTLEVPTSWSKFADAASLDRTFVEGFTSPDGRAGVQVAIFSKGSAISQETKAARTLEIMRSLYGWDMRVSTDKALEDGRERLEWYGEMKDVQGITYFDTSGTSLYIFSVIWEPATQDLYLPVLQEVIDSFAYTTFE
ncbi:MAG: hypothetical protein PWQ55_597 [Chloroflexota bacterium]|nr:hypothetical protein [Chloroflexota bacterium]